MRPASANGWSGARHQHQLVLEERAAADAGVAQRPHDGQLHLVAHDHVDERLRVARPHQQPHVRMRRHEAGEELGQDVGTDRGRRADRQFAHDALLELPDQGGASLQRFERPLGVRQERPPRVCQLHARAGPPEEGRAQVRLQGLDARRERRLADVERLGRAPDVPVADHRHEP